MFGRVRVRASQIETARRGLGKGVHQGSLWQRMKNGVRELSILITWMLESFIESGFSMKSRGCGLRGRTAYSIYRFDNRDRSLVVVLVACLGGGFDAGSDTGLLRPGNHLEPGDLLVLCVLRHLWSVPASAHGTGTVRAVAVSEGEEEYLVSIDFL